MRSGFRKKWDELNLKVEAKFREYSYSQKGKKRLKRMNGGYKCDKEYNEIVLPYWKKYGYKPKKMWYQIFADRDHVVDPRYIPDDLWFGTIVPYFSNPLFRRGGEDKCYHDVWFRDLKRPETLAKNIAGVFYDVDMNVISRNDVVNICMNSKGEFLIKPSIDSGEGRLISFFEPGKFTKENLEKDIDEMGANYIIQAAATQHPTLAKLNASSLNTIRIVSFFFEGEVHILSSILRIGATDAKVDNIGAGGFACPILENGQLNEMGVNRKAEWISENQHGIKFKDICVPGYQNVIDTIKCEHKKLAHFKLIGWDFAVDENETPVFIEFNSCPGPNQVTCGPTFGDLTEKVLEELFINRTLENAQN